MPNINDVQTIQLAMPQMTELLVVLAIIVVIFGAKRLPQLGDSMGKAIRNFKRSTSGEDEIEVGDRKEIEKE